jgi:hypothetical protein
VRPVSAEPLSPMWVALTASMVRIQARGASQTKTVEARSLASTVPPLTKEAVSGSTSQT